MAVCSTNTFLEVTMPKQRYLFITFANISQALRTERACQEAGIPGLLVPTPREVTAPCSMSWRGNPRDRQKIVAIMQQKNLSAEAIGEYIL